MLKSKPAALGGGVIIGAIGLILFLNMSPCVSLSFILFHFNGSLMPCASSSQNTPGTIKDSASLLFVPATSSVKVGNSFSLLLELDASGTAVNAASALVVYPTNVVKLVKTDESVTLFAFRLGDPSITNQVIQGQPNPGIIGVARMARLTFVALAPGQATISLASSAQVLANDGLGTNVLGLIKSASVTVSP
ncbi:MAG TPA: hypothetical protein VMU07_01485 [Candidatus Paceibacterota bacterium]|nr:hypothetical protein [Candidatus Paceibacterota bacterium]